MKESVVVFLFALTIGISPAYSQPPGDQLPGDQLPPAATSSPFALKINDDLASASSQVRSASARRCCNRKGALIGAAIGASLGAWLTASVCDAGNCTTTYARYMAVLGGIGAGLGAFADTQTPVTFPARQLPFQLSLRTPFIVSW
jgi:hypothetical protein